MSESSVCKLVCTPGSAAALKPLVAAAVSQRTLSVRAPAQEPDAWLRSVHGEPVLVTETGGLLFSPSAAARYLLTSAGGAVPAEVDVWLGWDSLVLQAAVRAGDGEALSRAVKKLEEAGPLPEPADYIVWSSLYTALVEGKQCLKQCQRLSAWLGKLSTTDVCKEALSRLGNSPTLSSAGGKQSSQKTKTKPLTKTPASVPYRKQESSVSTVESNEPAVRELSDEDLESALSAYLAGAHKSTVPVEQQHPVLPVKDKRNVLITSALPYVNNVPHLGNIIGCVLSADVFARFCRQRDYQTLFICGTDEYGTATETRAIQEGLTPRQVCDKYHAVHAEVYKWFNISFDHFGRTTTDHQTRIAQEMFLRVHENGFTREDSVDQLYCDACRRFLADRFVEGVCPLCGYEDARGDQCDNCGKLINATELKQPRCKLCQSTPAVRSSKHVFLDLPKLEAPLQAWFKQSSPRWTNNARVIGMTWLRDGLKPRCITRDLQWGTTVPLDAYKDKVFYVWFDAPIGYLSITAAYTDQWREWWLSPQHVDYYQFMAKDNVPFHAVVFPACQMATGQTYTMVTHLMATEYLNYEDGKFSKSRGVGVFGSDARETGIASDIWRFYLLSVRPENQDSSFSWDDLVAKNNSELLNNLGNFVNRALAFCARCFEGVVPDLKAGDDERRLIGQVSAELRAYTDLMERAAIRDAVRSILNVSRLGNQYMQAGQPWVLVKSADDAERQRAGSIIALTANLACLLAIMLEPFMPDTAAEMRSQLAVTRAVTSCLPSAFVQLLPAGHRIGKPAPLFQKLDPADVENLRSKYGGSGTDKAETNVAPSAVSPVTPATVVPSGGDEVKRLEAAVAQQGDEVRRLKAMTPFDKQKTAAAVAELLQLKQLLRSAQGMLPEPTKKSKNKKK